jgi:hypothetical protein
MDAVAQRGVLESGFAVTTVMDAVTSGARTIYLCGDFAPHDLVATLRTGGWTDKGSNLDKERPWLRFKHRTGLSVTIVSAANWLGDGDYSHHTARRVMRRLDREMWSAFASGVLVKPSTTGLEAWSKTAGDRWPALPREAQELIASTSGQGRFECCTLPGLEVIPDLYLLDGVMMYAASACAVEMSSEMLHQERPARGWLHGQDGVPGWKGWDRGRYRVRFVTPADWEHVGLLPVRAKQGWHWPTLTFPHESWADAAEVRLALAHGCWADAAEVRLALAHGWHVEILERLMFVKDGKAWSRPLSTWCRKLLAIREDLLRQAEPEDGHLYHAAVRNIIIQTIGAFASRARLVTRTLPADEWDAVPDDRLAQDTTRVQADGSVQFEEYELPKGRFAAIHHPEFAAAVWADTRVRLLSARQIVDGGHVQTGALHLPREAVCGFQLDGIFSTIDPGWADEVRPGRYRVKQHWPGPLPAPRSYADLLRLKGSDDA